MAKAPDFKYAPMFQLGEDKTEYRLISKEGVSTAEFEGKTILKVSKEALTLLAQQGFHDVEFMLRREHNAQVIESDVVIIIRLSFRISECILLQKEVDAAILALNHG